MSKKFLLLLLLLLLMPITAHAVEQTAIPCVLEHPSAVTTVDDQIVYVSYSNQSHWAYQMKTYYCTKCQLRTVRRFSTETEPHDTLGENGECSKCRSSMTYPLIPIMADIRCSIAEDHHATFLSYVESYVCSDWEEHIVLPLIKFSCSTCHSWGTISEPPSYPAPHRFTYVSQTCSDGQHLYSGQCMDCLYGTDVLLPCTGEPHAVPAS